MSFQAMTWAVEQDLPALQKLVLLMLANCSNQHTGRCDPSHDRLAKECGMSRNSVKRAIAELAEKGLIEIRRQTQEGVNLPNQYTLGVGSSVGVVGADRAHGVGPDRAEGGAPQSQGVGPDRATKQEVKPGSKPKALSADAEARSSRKSNPDTDPKFEDAWKAYPKREGGNSKQAALKAWNARVREGVDPGALLSATKAYAAAVVKAGNVGSRYVRQASTFFGPDRHFEEFAKPAGPHGRQGDDAAWWARAGFDKEWQAVSAGCSEKYAWAWRNGARLSESEIMAIRARGDA